MKKLLSLILAGAMMCALGVTAGAAEGADAKLAAVTAKVKTTLGIDTERYDQFYGEVSENALAPTWDLNWGSDNGSLRVTAEESGKVLRYNAYDNADSGISGGYAPALPTLSRADAQKAAQAFLDKVLEQGVETAQFYTDSGSWDQLSADSYYFNGVILLNGKVSPLSFNISVRVSDSQVTRFSRDGMSGQFIGGVPSAVAAVSAATAGEALKGILSLRLEYVLDADGKTAVLRYLPNRVDEYYVDGQTGKLVNLTELATNLRSGGGAAPSAKPEFTMGSMAKDSLTAAEQEGVAKMEGVLAKEDLGKKATAIAELGLAKYTLAGASYTVEPADKKDETPAADAKVTARLTYARQDKDGNTWRRYITLDAKTGALISVYSSMPWVDGAKYPVTETQAKTKAEAFLTKYEKDAFAVTARYETPGVVATPYAFARSGGAYGFTYAQKEGGYFFPANSLDVGIDLNDGSVSSYSKGWSEVQFASAEGIIGDKAALDAYYNTFDVVCGYIEVPQKLDLSVPEYRPLIDAGHSYLSALKLGYGLDNEADGYVEGIDAKTGEAVRHAPDADQSGLTYDDLAGHWIQEKAEKLAQYGVGFMGGSFQPAKTLTQLDLVALLISADGFRYDPAEKDAADQLYAMAYQMGIVTKAQRSDDKVMTRGEVVKLLLDSTGYQAIAALQGIYKCSFADEGSIPAAYYGYAALAQGLGVVGGNSGGSFAAETTATRAEAAGMLYNLMNR